MLSVYELVRKVAPTDLPVVIAGETGTGKELVAQAVHSMSRYAAGPLIDINCAAIPEQLVESELFGHERGAYTGAVNSSPGLLELAKGGTLFLDEACSLGKAAQSKLLRAIETRRHRRVGGQATIQTEFRIVLALQQPLADLVSSDRYLAAFAHRVNGVAINLPPLNARGRDIRLLANYFLTNGYTARVGELNWTEDALDQLERMKWPGNVRQLRALVARLQLLVTDNHVKSIDVLAAQDRGTAACTEADTLQAALDRNGGCFSRAARELGMARTTFRSRLLAAAAD